MTQVPWPRPEMPPRAGAGHWSRHYGVARAAYKSMEAIDDHVAALRSEWDRR